MNIVELDARLVDSKHTEHLIKVNAMIFDGGPLIPIRVTHNKRVFELSKIKKGIVVYSQK